VSKPCKVRVEIKVVFFVETTDQANGVIFDMKEKLRPISLKAKVAIRE